jgi:RNA polymerase sigma factor (sigma-70 family)
MTSTQPKALLQQVRKLAGEGLAAAPDGQLLERFAGQRDEAAFTALLKRHGPMVLSVCRGILRNYHDAEDAFQATFLVLARKADTIRRRQSVSSWLHEVAYHVAVKARARAARREPEDHRPEATTAGDPVLDLTLRDVQRVVHEELRRLPEKYRAPLVLCYLEARTQDEAARQLGCTAAALHGRLHRGRERLRARLARRGLTLGTGLLPALLSPDGAEAAVPAALLAATGKAVAGGAPAQVASLAGSVVPAALGRTRSAALLLLAFALLGVAAGVLARQMVAPPPLAETAPAQPSRQPSQPRVDAHGDPLPPGALARLGTVRFRHAGQVTAVTYSPDGKIIAAAAGRMVRLWEADTGRPLRRLRGEFGRTTGLVFSPDGKMMAAEGPSPIRLWEVATGKEVGRLGGYLAGPEAPREEREEGRRKLAKEPPFEGHRGGVWSVAFSPDGKVLASAGGDLMLWDLGKKRLSRTLLEAKQGAHLVAFAPDGKTLASVSSGRPGVAYQGTVLRLWNVRTGSEQCCFQAHAEHIQCIAFAPDGKTLASAGHDKTVKVWDVSSGKLLRALRGPEGAVTSMSFSPDGKFLAATAFPSTIHLWDAATGKPVRQIKEAEGLVSAAAFSPDGKTLASGSESAVRLWDVATGKERLPGGDPGAAGLCWGSNDSGVWSVAFSPDGKTLATRSRHRAVQLWQAATGKEVRRLGPQHLGNWGNVVFSPDGKTVVAAAYEYPIGPRIGLWASSTGKFVRQFGTHPDLRYLGVSADGKRIVAAGPETIELWEVNTGRARRFSGHKGAGYYPTLSRDGKFLAVVDVEGAIVLWETDTGKVRRRWHKKCRPSRLALSPRGRLLAVGTEDGLVRLWDTATGAELRRFQAHRGRLEELVFAPTGKALVTGDESGSVQLWEVATGQERRRFTGHQGRILALAYSADGTAIASGSADCTALVWDVTGHRHEGRQIVRLSPARLGALWAALADRDAGRAHSALWALVAGASDALPFLAERLQPVRGERAQIERWIEQLDHDDFAVRERAMEQLRRSGPLAGPALRKALAGKPSLEVHRRLQRLVGELARRALAPEVLRDLRAIEALEHMKTPAALRVLQRLARGASAARQTEAARAALEGP